MVRVLILCAGEDEALGTALAQVLTRAGHHVLPIPTREEPDIRLAVWTRRSRSSRRMQCSFSEDPQSYVVALCDDASPPGTAVPEQCFDLRHWSGDAADARLAALAPRVAQAATARAAELLRRASAPDSGPVRAGLPQDDPDHGFANTGAPALWDPRPSLPLAASPLPPPVPERAGSAPGSRGGLGGLLGRFFSRSPAPDSMRGPQALPMSAPLDPAPVMGEPPPVSMPVAIAVTAPRQCIAGTPFVAALSAYVEAMREQALQHLAALGESGDRRVVDVPSSDWRVGAPVCVRLAADGATVTPAEHRAIWYGRELLAPFTVVVLPGAGTAVMLQFAVFVADVPVAALPMLVTVGVGDATPKVVHARSASSAFASYSSKDAQLVSQRLSTLARWAPGLDIFLDCLDLRPGEDFKPQLALQIAARDVFLLFWSRRAAASPWVRWEFETAVAQKQAEAILPMPIEDPAVAPLPPELSQRHLRDRYLLAGYALQQIHDEQGVKPGPR
jgi:hypothetical protein